MGTISAEKEERRGKGLSLVTGVLVSCLSGATKDYLLIIMSHESRDSGHQVIDPVRGSSGWLVHLMHTMVKNGSRCFLCNREEGEIGVSIRTVRNQLLVRQMSG